MITDAIFGISAGIVSLVVGMFPLYTPAIVNEFTSAFVWAFGYLRVFNFALPVTEFMTIFVWYIYFELILFSVRIIIWLINFLPFVEARPVDRGSSSKI